MAVAPVLLGTLPVRDLKVGIIISGGNVDVEPLFQALTAKWLTQGDLSMAQIQCGITNRASGHRRPANPEHDLHWGRDDLTDRRCAWSSCSGSTVTWWQVRGGAPANGAAPSTARQLNIVPFVNVFSPIVFLWTTGAGLQMLAVGYLIRLASSRWRRIRGPPLAAWRSSLHVPSQAPTPSGPRFIS